MRLLDLLRSLLPVDWASDNDLRRIEAAAAPHQLGKGERLPITSGVAGALVTDGCLRAYFVEPDGDERVLYFAPAGWWIPGSARRAVAGPGMTIEALEPSQVWTIEQTTLMSAPAFEHVRIALAERTLRALQQRLVGAMRKTAAERYYEFQRLYPGLDARISQYHIAEYLGVSPEFLSRLRTRLLRESHATS
jgi:CRP-like cAMP-binding protein